MSDDDYIGRTFSDSWHRVAKVRVALRASVRAHRQMFRGQEWMVLRDALTTDWFRITAEAWRFVSRLSTRRTVEEVWMEMVERDSDAALSQEEVVQLLGHLNLSNLLIFDRSGAGASLFERYKKRTAKERRALWMGFLSIRIPLIDPDRVLRAAMPLIRLCLSPMGALIYLLLLAVAGKTLIDHSDALFSQGAGLLAPSNLGLLYVGFVIAKVIHELGHAAVCRYFGGEVHKFGVMLLIFAPLPYVDATASWGFRKRGERLLTGSAGVLAELAVAAVAALVWAHTAPGAINAIAYNVIFVASVSSLLFNLNPLLRFDGYHMLVDLIDIPNLFQRSREQLKYLAERYLFVLPKAQPAARTASEAWLLPIYGVLSLVYWLMLMSTIVFFIAEQYLDLGVLLAWVLAFTVIVVPLFKFLRYLFTSPKLTHRRMRTTGITAALVALIVGPLILWPMPDRVRASGVVEAVQYRQLNSEATGEITEILARPGDSVQSGQPLIRLSSISLDFDLQAAREQREQLLAQELRATAQTVADLEPLRRQREAVESMIAELERQRAALIVRAPIAGVWSAPDLELARGRWVGRGASLGSIVDPALWRFVAVLPQVATHVFDNDVVAAEIRLKGEEHLNLLARDVRLVPFETGVLPSRALGFSGGGDIAVAPGDQKGVTAAEPFYRIYANFAGSDPGAVLMHGRLGMLRLTLSDMPLLLQWERGIRQFLQRRFRV
jgi:putative peptide zinc metalloprotease protein